MNNNKVSFIICKNKDLVYDECVRYINALDFPDGITYDIIPIEGAEYITQAYNKAMNSSDAKYKVYLHQDIHILNKDFIYDILDIFSDDKIGLIGIAGSKKITGFLETACWDSGNFYENCNSKMVSQNLDKSSNRLIEVQAVNGILMATQYDIPWREDILKGWHFYDISQSLEFQKNGYKIVVPNYHDNWVLHDNGKVDWNAYLFWKKIFLDNYREFINSIAGISDDIISVRKKCMKYYDDMVDASIVIVAYNRLEITKKCIECVLENTKNINYKLIMVYNENEQGAGILDYFNQVPYDNKIVVHIPNNNGAPFAYQQIQKYIEGKYIVHLPNDVIVTPNWLSNLIKCAESDDRIGMVNPVSSNVSNYQQVDLEFNNNDEMQTAAGKYNVSDPLKWFERMRLITLGTLFTRECLSAVGYIFDIGFTHNFGDDDISFRVRRAGYKAVLATDTWVHHSHENFGRKFYDLESGRKCFRDKYYGIDAWNDVKNFIPEVKNVLEKPSETNEIAILGVDVKCGTPILEIKNKLRSFEIFDPECFAITSEGKYFIDLQTVCGADNVLAGSPDAIYSEFEPESFDYIIIGNNINEYPEPLKLLKKIYSLLKKGGQMFIYLKNTFDVYSFLNVIGFSQVMQASCSYNISVERFVELLDSNKISAELISCIPYADIPNEYIAEVNNRGAMFVKENIGITQVKLTCDKFLFKLSK